jgi:hypothetical protein
MDSIDDMIYAYEEYLALPQQIRKKLPFSCNPKIAWLEPFIQHQISMKKMMLSQERLIESISKWSTSQSKKK